MKQTKNILLTFDHEPFLGARTGSLEKCMIEPLGALMQLFIRHKVKTVFFVDVLCLIHFEKQNASKDIVKKIKDQLINLYSEGHFIFPHLHPHWLDSVYIKEEKQFDLSNLTKYSLSKLTPEEIEKLFSQAINYLNDLGIHHTEWGYRAGGWCIQPFHLYKKIFTRNNITSDFSVLPGYKNQNKDQAFDYSNVSFRDPYFFSDQVELADEKGSFIEYPISTTSISPIASFKDKLYRKYLWNKGDKGWGDGLSAQTGELRSNNSNEEMVSIDILNIVKFKGYKNYLKKHDFMHWISHPKMLTKHGLKTFDSFLSFANSNYDIESNFHEMLPAKK